jgi:Mrp family chromosome partitioning ATPase
VSASAGDITLDPAAPPAGARVIPVGGGKGGVGKTFLVANLATALARSGYRVVAVDSDLEGANLHTCLGVPRPRCSLADFVAQREEDLAKLLIDTPVQNLQLIAPRPSRVTPAESAWCATCAGCRRTLSSSTWRRERIPRSWTTS